MSEKTVAVIVPVYNSESALIRCIDSVLGQTDPDLQLILLDDGSTDRSGELCDHAAQKDSRVKVIHKDNEGLIATWIRGVRETDAPYLCFLDSDDYLETEMLAAMKARLSGKKEIICCSYTIDREWNGTQEKKTHGAAPGEYVGADLEEKIKNRILGNEIRTVISSRCMKLFSRALIEENISYCDKRIPIGEDMVITTPAILDAERIVIMPDAYFYHYTFVRESMVHSYNPRLLENMRLLRDKLSRILTDKGIADADQMAKREYLFLFFQEMKNELRRTGENAKGAVKDIQKICLEERSDQLAALYPEKLTDPSYRLILWMMRRPSVLRIMVIRAVFLLQQGIK